MNGYYSYVIFRLSLLFQFMSLYLQDRAARKRRQAELNKTKVGFDLFVARSILPLFMIL